MCGSVVDIQSPTAENRLLLLDGIFPGAKFTLRPSHALFYIGSVTVRHSSSGRQPHYGVVQ